MLGGPFVGAAAMPTTFAARAPSADLAMMRDPRMSALLLTACRAASAPPQQLLQLGLLQWAAARPAAGPALVLPPASNSASGSGSAGGAPGAQSSHFRTNPAGPPCDGTVAPQGRTGAA